MLKATVFGILVAGAMVLSPTAAHAQCVRLSPLVSCSHSTQPSLKLDFGAPKTASKRYPSIAGRVLPSLPTPTESKGSDCQIVTPTDQQFYSAMPLIKPDPSVRLPMTVIPVPSCRR